MHEGILSLMQMGKSPLLRWHVIAMRVVFLLSLY